MKYWLNLHTDTFIRRKNGVCLLYNAANGNKKIFKVTPCITPYLTQLQRQKVFSGECNINSVR